MKLIAFETACLRIELNTNSEVVSLCGKADGTEYLPAGQGAPLLSVRCGGEFETPSRLERHGDALKLFFDKNQVEAEIQTYANADYLGFELVKISNHAKIELVLWGPFPTTIKETVGESVGVVRDRRFALGIQALNMKTLGGYPHFEDDTEIESVSWDDSVYQDNWVGLTKLDPDSFVRRRGDAAAEREFGSVLQAYCRNRDKARIINNRCLGLDRYVAPAFDDGGVVGSKIALFGCSSDQALATLGRIELAEGLPHPVIDGEWFKTSPRATETYCSISARHFSFDEAMELVHKAGSKHLYLHDFESWGHFAMDSELFPDNWTSLRQWVEKAKAQGVEMGIHTLSNFITINDAYVTPVPDQRLAKVGSTVLAADVSAEEGTLPIVSPEFFNQTDTFHATMLGNEIVCYKEVSATEPWQLTGCVRGAFGTAASAHRRGDTIGKLVDHGYWVFLGDAALNDEIAVTLARLCNETGLTRFAFDGIEGTGASGLGAYAFNRIVTLWYQNLKPDLQGRIFWESSIPTHFNWHAGTAQNWGEAHYASFRLSQLSSRLSNLGFYRRNYLPCMLGCFKINVETTVEDAEWLGARAAGHDAGFSLSFFRQEKPDWGDAARNVDKEAILAAIKTWEAARAAGAFSPEQKALLRRMDLEFHLEAAGKEKWRLTPFQVDRLEIIRAQPGSVTRGELQFDNPYCAQPLRLSAQMLPIGYPRVAKTIIRVNGGEPFEIAASLEQYESLKLDESGNARTFAMNWRPLHAARTKGPKPLLATGKNRIEFEIQFLGAGSAKLQIEVKAAGETEPATRRSHCPPVFLDDSKMSETGVAIHV